VDDFLATATAINSDSTTSGKVVLGLKTALKVGIDSGSGLASKVNGYLANKAIKILLPERGAKALDAAQQVGAYVKPFKDELTLMQSAVNLTLGTDQKTSFQSNLSGSTTLLADIRWAGHRRGLPRLLHEPRGRVRGAAFGPIFKNAITGMTITDGLALLNSSDSIAATAYLDARTFTPLSAAYTPIVDSTLALVPLTQYWGRFRTTYNSVLTRYDQLLAFQQSWNGNAVWRAFLLARSMRWRRCPINPSKPRAWARGPPTMP